MDEKQELNRLEKRLMKRLAETSIRYGVITPGDRILVAVSGGKDSYGLLHLLVRMLPRLPFKADLVACHLSQGQPGVDVAPLVDWMGRHGIPLELVEEDTYSVVQRHLKPGETPCAICSRLRRGILYTTARRLGCNKVALGHHREDALATLLLNLFFAGTLQSMPARYRTDDGGLEVVRPLIEVREADLVRLSELLAFPIVPCSLCDRQPNHHRILINRLLNDLEKEYPDIKHSMLGAIKNVHPTHLLDPLVTRIR
jgi:tRNA 2-thiocytidine biosynthesis protein TtcA